MLIFIPFLILSQSKSLYSTTDSVEQEAREDKLTSEIRASYNNTPNDPKFLKKIHKVKSKIKTIKGKLNLYILTALHFQRKTKLDSSIYYTKKCLDLKIDNDSINARVRSYAYSILGINYYNQGLYSESKKWYLKGIEEANKFNEINFYYHNIHGLALLYSKLEEYQPSIELFEKCLEYKEDPEIMLGSYINLGLVYSKQEKVTLSNQYLKKAEELGQKFDNEQAKANILTILAANHVQLGDFEKASQLYQEAIEIAKKNSFLKIVLTSFIELGIAQAKRKNYNKAESMFLRALESAEKYGFLDLQIIIHDNIKNLGVDQNNYKKAFIFQSIYNQLKDSITQLQNKKEVNQLEIVYKTREKEREIKLLQLENRNRNLIITNQQEVLEKLRLTQEIEQKENENRLLQYKNASNRRENSIKILKRDKEIQEIKLNKQRVLSNLFLYISVPLSLLTIGLFIVYHQKLKTQNKLNKTLQEVNSQKIQSILKDQELKVIEASIEGQDKERKRIAQELHDSIGGNLAAIKLQLGNISDSSVEEINIQIDETYNLARSLSHNLAPKRFGKNKFCDVFENYIEKIGDASNLRTSLSVFSRTSIDNLKEKIQIEIFKVLQELVINTVKHAEASNIEIEINSIDQKLLTILYTDDGKGFEPRKNNNGLGLDSVKSRIKSLNGIINIDSILKKGIFVTMEIPT